MIVLVRHGQSTANAGGLLLGRADPPLTELGRRQATAVATVLAPLVAAGARIVSSPLQRARVTAAALGGPVEVDERWVELDYGVYDEQPLSAVPGEIWDRWRADPGFTPPGGESLAALGARVRAACRDLAAASGDTIVVSHVSPVKAAVAWALDVGDEVAWRMHLGVAAITRIAVGPRGPSLHGFNDCAHLQGLDRSAGPSPARGGAAGRPRP